MRIHTHSRGYPLHLRQLVCESTILCVEEGERDDKAASPTRCALHTDRPTVLLNDASGNGEAKSHSWLRASVFGPIKTLEEPGQVGLIVNGVRSSCETS